METKDLEATVIAGLKNSVSAIAEAKTADALLAALDSYAGKLSVYEKIKEVPDRTERSRTSYSFSK